VFGGSIGIMMSFIHWPSSLADDPSRRDVGYYGHGLFFLDIEDIELNNYDVI
jgi:hypothetical protein